jgi:hypothetical protein
VRTATARAIPDGAGHVLNLGSGDEWLVRMAARLPDVRGLVFLVLWPAVA